MPGFASALAFGGVLVASLVALFTVRSNWRSLFDCRPQHQGHHTEEERTATPRSSVQKSSAVRGGPPRVLFFDLGANIGDSFPYMCGKEAPIPANIRKRLSRKTRHSPRILQSLYRSLVGKKGFDKKVTVYAFEGNRELCGPLQKVAKQLEGACGQIEVFCPAAVTAFDARRTIRFCSEPFREKGFWQGSYEDMSVGSSIEPDKRLNGGKDVTCEDVKNIDLCDFIPRVTRGGIDRIVLKANIEGSKYSLVPGMLGCGLFVNYLQGGDFLVSWHRYNASAATIQKDRMTPQEVREAEMRIKLRTMLVTNPERDWPRFFSYFGVNYHKLSKSFLSW
ncbi:unnamed protein product [Vitrella brassicaformis CCMP3155]|uniref:Methyltransferase FkbM domain-containing protein n=1 Tax=Vitrella brassicaformis (strain CCMP3155) TaxID=1169540 RepID=A0A0G4G2U4_VITBC|nr:unnamed protein product [Vitrella brassicaformis CCMP3155]|eukprot:CEM22507.1 unnamed protein product [Vitrella brassicaformis CCMP3155]